MRELTLPLLCGILIELYVSSVGGDHEFAFRSGTYAVLVHQAPHAFLADPDPAGEQFLVHARPAVFALGMDGTAKIGMRSLWVEVSSFAGEPSRKESSSYKSTMASRRMLHCLTKSTRSISLETDLVHRGGVVSSLDANDGDELEVRWSALVLLAVKGEQEEEIVPPQRIEAGTTVGIATRPRSKTIPIGQRLEITSTDFAQMCWTIFLFAQTCAERLEEHGKRRGVELGPSAT